ncbi:hypothetical protein ID866_10859 [Astraeus odoratus]|nr:hypothetical protein ID866_10859 [Astraeus odoratus]
MTEADTAECVDVAVALKGGWRGKEAGLGVTLYIGETKDNTVSESLGLLDWRPDRLGHAAFLSGEHKVLFLADVPQPGVDDSSDVPPRHPAHPLHGVYTTAYHKHLERIYGESTEPEAARQMLSYHIDADKGARRAALKDVEALGKQNGAYKPCIEVSQL